MSNFIKDFATGVKDACAQGLNTIACEYAASISGASSKVEPLFIRTQESYSIEFTSPSVGSKESAGLDLYYAESPTHLLTLHPNEPVVCRTGIMINPNYRYILSTVLTICSRSGMAAKGLIVANAPAIIDWDYPDEIKVILVNVGNVAREIRGGSKIAQMVELKTVSWVGRSILTDMVVDPERIPSRTGGLGSTDTQAV